MANDEQDLYFDLMADIGHTKHVGGQDATDALLAALNPRPGLRVLDVGCGIGLTAAALAAQGCRVHALDLRPRMLEHARANAQRAGVAGQARFEAGDMNALPFADESFDAVLAESVLSFAVDKLAVLCEIRRVLRPDGRFALTESIWVKPPPPQMAAGLNAAAGLPAGLLRHDEWLALLDESGLREVRGTAHPLDMREEARAQMGRTGGSGYLRLLGRLPRVLFNPAYRGIYRSALSTARPDLDDYYGYGIYTAVNPAPMEAGLPD